MVSTPYYRPYNCDDRAIRSRTMRALCAPLSRRKVRLWAMVVIHESSWESQTAWWLTYPSEKYESQLG